MTFQEMAIRLLPSWILGIIMIYAVLKSEHKDLMRIDWKTVRKWATVLGGAMLIRLAAFWAFKYMNAPMDGIKTQLQAVGSLPIGGVFFVYWEDACHGLPLILLSRMLPSKWYTWPLKILAFLTVMLAFGSGHIYQGWTAAMFLMLYIPFSMKMGQKHGFGTVMLGHIMYDLTTLLMVKMVLGWL